MEKKSDSSTKSNIIIGILVIIAIAIISIAGVFIVKTNSLAQLKTVEVEQVEHVASSELNKATSKTLKVDSKGVLVKGLNKSNKTLKLAKAELQSKNLLVKDLNKNSKHLLLTGLKDHKGLLRNELAYDKHVLEVLSLQPSLKSHLLVDVLSVKEVL